MDDGAAHVAFEAKAKRVRSLLADYYGTTHEGAGDGEDRSSGEGVAAAETAKPQLPLDSNQFKYCGLNFDSMI